MTEQVSERRRKRTAKAPGLRFDPGRVFDPAEGREDDFKLDLEAARFKAKKGQAGNRRQGGPHHSGCACIQCLYMARYGGPFPLR